MPEYLYPGVYVEEIEAQLRPIPGVSTSLEDAAWTAIAADFRRTMGAHAPGWTDFNDSDPGETLVEVFAFLSENLLYRAGEVPERARVPALRAAVALEAFAQATETAGCAGLTRPRYFEGKLLDAATLTAEQEYHREKRRLHNRAIFGFGVVSGLGVSVEPAGASGGERVLVEPGCAIDRLGEEIRLPQGVSVAAPSSGDSAFVTVRYWERPCAPTPTIDGTTAASKIEEACVLALKSAVADPAIPLARLIRIEGAWRLDPAFETPKIRRA
jgi:hypothetical protein